MAGLRDNSKITLAKTSTRLRLNSRLSFSNFNPKKGLKAKNLEGNTNTLSCIIKIFTSIGKGKKSSTNQAKMAICGLKLKTEMTLKLKTEMTYFKNFIFNCFWSNLKPKKVIKSVLLAKGFFPSPQIYHRDLAETSVPENFGYKTREGNQQTHSLGMTVLTLGYLWKTEPQSRPAASHPHSHRMLVKKTSNRGNTTNLKA